MEGVGSRLAGVLTDLLESYRIPGEQTDLAGISACCGQLGSDPGALFGVVQGLVLHEYAFRPTASRERYGQHHEAGWCGQVAAAGMLLRSTETR